MSTDDGWVHALLTRTLDGEPELGLRPEAVLADARRRLARRRAALAGSATVVLMLAIGTVVSQHGPAGPERAIGGTKGTTRPPQPGETTIHGLGGPLVVDARSRELTAALAGARAIPPGVTASAPTQSYGSVGNRPLTFYRVPIGQYAGSYYAEANLTDAHGTGHLIVRVWNQATQPGCTGAPANWQPCATVVLPDGTHVTSMRYVPPGPPYTAEWQIELERPNGTVVDVYCGNWSLSGGIDHATGAEPPMGKDALLALAGVPGLDY